MSAKTPETVMCFYQVRRDAEPRFRDLLRRHHPTLARLGLVTDEPPQHFRGEDQEGRPFYVEIFSWKDASAPAVAHQTPEVMAIWEPMGELVEDRNGRPKFEFPHVAKVSFGEA